jgi:arylsulfate sulfotransferase
MRKIAVIASLLLTSLLAGCGSSSSGPVMIEAAVAPSPAAVAVGTSLGFTATVTGNTSNLAVTWAVNGTPGGNSTLGIIDANGNYTAPAATSSTPITVSATSVADPQVSGPAAVHLIVSGQVSTTTNPLVALYTRNPSSGGTVSV